MSGRCLSCNKVMNDFEMTRKYSTGEYLGLCNSCYYTISNQITVQEREDLRQYEDITEEDKDELTW